MPIDVIDSFRLGTDRPLDNRYIANSVYDVSLYWYDGMQVYEPSTNRVYLVRNASLGVIEALLYDFDEIDGGDNWTTPTGDYVDGGTW